MIIFFQINSLGEGLGPTFILTDGFGLTNPFEFTRQELIDGVTIDVNDDAQFIYIKSTGILCKDCCEPDVKQQYVLPTTTTTSTSTTTTTTSTSTTTTTSTTTLTPCYCYKLTASELIDGALYSYINCLGEPIVDQYIDQGEIIYICAQLDSVTSDSILVTIENQEVLCIDNAGCQPTTTTTSTSTTTTTTTTLPPGCLCYTLSSSDETVFTYTDCNNIEQIASVSILIGSENVCALAEPIPDNEFGIITVGEACINAGENIYVCSGGNLIVTNNGDNASSITGIVNTGAWYLLPGGAFPLSSGNTVYGTHGAYVGNIDVTIDTGPTPFPNCLKLYIDGVLIQSIPVTLSGVNTYTFTAVTIGSTQTVLIYLDPDAC